MFHFLILLALYVPMAFADEIALNYLKPNHEQYQDIVINNVVVSKGVRECASRYEAIKPILGKYKRPFTMLDIGASQGYFSFRAAYDFPQSTFVMIEGNYNNGGKWQIADQLFDLCKLNTELNNIIFLKRLLKVDDLELLGSCEHFDVILAFNVIHHMGSEWQRWADAVFALGDTIILETPPGNEKIITQYHDHLTMIENYCFAKGGKVICETPRHTDPTVKAKMFLFENKKEKIDRCYWTTEISPNKVLKVVSTFNEKILIKSQNNITRISPWMAGINLLTFKMMNGVYPLLDDIKEKMMQFTSTTHRDPFIWNMIIQGATIKLIDWDPLTDWDFDPVKAMKYNCVLLDMSPEKVPLFIYENKTTTMCLK